ncbi:MAG: UDP-N-acetyl-D-glucosamine dehydrogenase [Actinomycetota bacterium]|jgi:nucleotide sugar dehydrogenase|nr:UDP-N-acetyl-D-glucosamine dehydrogenase [Actinomycetota bacterium]
MSHADGDAPKRVVIVGQGYVGLPLAVGAANAGWTVVGVDVDKGRVDALNDGHSPVGDISDAQLSPLLDAGRYSASVNFGVVSDADVVVLCVPTPYRDDAPDLSYIEESGRQVGRNLSQGCLVILESTTYPGTTEEILLPILQDASGLTAGQDFQVAFSPERIDPGNPTYGLHNTPKIVGGVTDEATARAADFYGSFVDTVVPVSGPKSAEMAKLLENTFRHINIALVNELAVLCRDLDVDVWEVIDAAASKPFGFMPFYPGPGVGGHCIPVDPMYLSWRVKQFGGAAKFIDLARDVNAGMPLYVVTRIQDLLNDRERSLRGSRITVVGVAYKPNISDMRESPALPLIELLRRKGATISYVDPFVPTLRLEDGSTLEAGDADQLVADSDCVVIVTAHAAIDHDVLAAKAPLVFDTRNVVRSRAAHIHRL